MDFKTSWSNDDLRKLIIVDNHKIVYVGYEYTWYRKLEDNWEIHFIRNFSNKKKAFAYLKYNISKWTRELNKRLENENRRGAYKHIEKMLDNQEKIYSIAKSSLPTIEKINHIRLINKETPIDELSIILRVQKSIIYRHIRTLKSRGTLLCA